MDKVQTRFLDIDCYGENTGAHYAFQAEVKLHLNQRERAEIARKISKLTFGIDRSNDMFHFLAMVATLEAHLASKPEFWGEDGLDCFDVQPFHAIAIKLRECQAEYAKENSGGKVIWDEVK